MIGLLKNQNVNLSIRMIGNFKRTSGNSFVRWGPRTRLLTLLSPRLNYVSEACYTIRAFLNPKEEIFRKPVGIFRYLKISLSCFVRIQHFAAN